MANDNRFKITKPDGGKVNAPLIIVDTETGVNYLFYKAGYAGGLTPLLNSDGTPVVTPRTK